MRLMDWWQTLQLIRSVQVDPPWRWERCRNSGPPARRSADTTSPRRTSPSVATLGLGGVDHPGGGFKDPGGGPERARCDPALPASGRDGDQEPIDA